MSPRIAAAISIAVLVWVVVCTQQDHMAVNPASRYATMESLVEHGTFVIDDTHLVSRTVDKVRWNDHYYSSKPPLLPALLAPAYALVRAVTGEGFREAMYPTVRVLRLFVAVLPWAAAMWLWVLLVRRITSEPDERGLLIVAMLAGGLPTAYASHLDNHSFGFLALLAAAVAAAPWYADAARARTASVVGAGLAAGAAVAFDLGSAPVTAGFLAWAAWALRRRPTLAAALIVAAAVAPLCQMGLQWVMVGDPRPFYLQPQAYDYPGSYWRNTAEFDALTEPRGVYLFHALLGHHGLFSVTPWFLLALPWFVRRETTAVGESLRRVAIATTLFVVGYYVLKTVNYGGRCVGMRWFMVLHPIFAVAAAREVVRGDLVHRRGFLLGVLIALSAVSALGGAINPWEEGFVHALFRGVGMGSVPG